ncbi:MAG: 6-phosphogluconolactonase [Clostridiales bacterium]|nr:6-phosphogluconolactonase [Clostridiales bacterium]
MGKQFKVDRLNVFIHDSREEMGKKGAAVVAEKLRGLLSEKDEVNIIFASSPSQDDLLGALAKEPGIEWWRVNAFHMDEYSGLDISAKQSFANYLKVGFFSQVGFKDVFYMDGLNDPRYECARYSVLLEKYPTDVTLIGIGENGHIGFNDPYMADFFDPGLVVINGELDPTCREQQVADGWFETIGDVPKGAVTVSVYGLLKAPAVFATVPGIRKAGIVKRCLEGAIGIECPSTGIRLHRDATLFLDNDSSSLLTI